MVSNSEDQKLVQTKPSVLRWWWKEIIFPFGSAILAIVFFLQAFKIPSSSMEDTLLINDFLLGLKAPYGSNLPWSDHRVPGFVDPKPGDVLIFKYPGDPQIPDDNPSRYVHLVNLLFLGNWYWDKNAPEGKFPLVHYTEGPREFIKRCVAQSGQTVEVRNKILYVDGQPQMPLSGKGKWMNAESKHLQFRDMYDEVRLPSPGQVFYLDTMKIAELYRLRSLMTQENPGHRFELELSLKIDGKDANDHVFQDLFFPRFQLNKYGDTVESHKPTFVQYQALKITRGPQPDTSVDYSFNGQLQQSDNLLESGLLMQVPFKYFAEQALLGHNPIRVPASTDKAYYISPYGAAEDDHGRIRQLSYSYFNVQDLILLERYVNTHNALRAERLAKDSAVGLATPALPHYQLIARIKEDGKVLQNYTVKDKVYFMMGDNRDNSEDSRFWGFVARRSVSAKAFIIYFSYENRAPNEFQFSLMNPLSWPMIFAQIRWTRIGKLIHGL